MLLMSSLRMHFERRFCTPVRVQKYYIPIGKINKKIVPYYINKSFKSARLLLLFNKKISDDGQIARANVP
jgi:hypothetical protein